MGDILCLPIKDKAKSSHAMLGQHRQVIFKEDMFDVIDNAHKNGERHRGYKGTFKKINATYCNIPREVVHKYVNMCQFCQKAHACFIPTTLRNTTNKLKKRVEQQVPAKKKEIEMTFLTRCQIDILDMQAFPDADGQFSYIGHFLDHHTKYNVLFPLKRTDPLYVARKLCRYVLGHFGLPHILHSNLGRKFVDDLITWILQFWSTDAQIVNGNPRLKKMNTLIQQRQKTIMILIETIRAKQGDVSSWSVWLPGIQYSLNTNQFESENPPSYDIVFNRRPKVYTYAPSVKEIAREEEMVEGDDTQDNNMNEVITVSVSDFIQSGEESILISHMNPHDPEKVNNSQKELSTDLLNTATLDSIPLSLGDQYAIIGTALNVDTHTIQIPVVNLDTNTLTITDQGNHDETGLNVTDFDEIGDSVVKESMVPHTGETSVTGSLELNNESVNTSLELPNENVASLELSNDGVENTLELSNLEMDVKRKRKEDVEKCGDDDKDEIACYSMKDIQPNDINVDTEEEF